MADEYRSQRETHYNHQRSPLRSDRSATSSPPPLSLRSQDYALPTDFENLNEVEAAAPVQNPREAAVYYRSRALEDEKRRRRRSGGSRAGSSTQVRQGWPLRDVGEASTTPENFDRLDEVRNPAPVENPSEASLYRHQFLETDPSRTSTPLSRRSTPQPSLLSRRLTDPNLTALPTIPDHGSREDLRQEISVDQLVASGNIGGGGRTSGFATEFYTISYLSFFSIFGTLARLGIQWLTFYPGAPVIFPVLWANFAGTLFMGFLAEDRRLFRENSKKVNAKGKGKLEVYDEEKGPEPQTVKDTRTKFKKELPLYIGLATGFCGSLTSFSSFIRDVFFALENGMPSPVVYPDAQYRAASTSPSVPRNGGYSFLAVCAVIILTVTVCHGALKVGAHIAIFLGPITPSLSPKFLDAINRGAVLLGFGVWLGAVFMAIWPPDRPGGPVTKGSWTNETWRGEAVFACAFAPVGCLLRFYVSLKLNGLISSFPLGTFGVNIFGTAVQGMAFDLQHLRLGEEGLVGGGRVPCQVLQGVMDGVCGCLTTVSTWILELNGLRRGHAYRYGLASVVCGLGVLVAVMGSVRWSVGFREAVCVI